MVKEMHSAAVREAWHRSVPQARYGAPEEIAGAVRFLLEEAASGYVTGQTLCVDGGFSVVGLH
jgi:NAD(P)-dependent dehydrogenase (short-subunit alcohol dehydrogenase family)